MTRLELLRIRYAVVRNVTGDSTLDRKASQWSNERIQREFGVVVRKAPLRPVAKTKTAQRTYRYYKQYLELGYTPEVARKLKNKKPLPIQIVKSFSKEVPSKFNKTTKQDRKDQWSTWVKTINKNGKNAIPTEFKQYAAAINKFALSEFASDDNARYGYAVMYYAYVNQMSIEEVMDVLRPERFDGDIYQITQKI